MNDNTVHYLERLQNMLKAAIDYSDFSNASDMLEVLEYALKNDEAKKPDNSQMQAFPVVFGDTYIKGMTLRDWFAGQCLAGLYADPEVSANKRAAADCCYSVADAMMERRAKDKFTLPNGGYGRCGRFEHTEGEDD